MPLRQFLGWLASFGDNMAAYYLPLRPWTALGTSEFMLRGPSVAFSMASAVVLFYLARRLFDLEVALIAAVLMVLTGSFIRYAQEARGYAELLLVCVGWLALLLVLEKPTPRRQLLYVLSGILSVYTHLLGVVFVATQALALLVLKRETAPWAPADRGLGPDLRRIRTGRHYSAHPRRR